MNYPRSCLTFRGLCNIYSPNVIACSADVSMITCGQSASFGCLIFRSSLDFPNPCITKGNNSYYTLLGIQAGSDVGLSLRENNKMTQQNYVWPTEFCSCQWKYPENFIYSREIPTMHKIYFSEQTTMHKKIILVPPDTPPPTMWLILE